MSIRASCRVNDAAREEKKSLRSPPKPLFPTEPSNRRLLPPTSPVERFEDRAQKYTFILQTITYPLLPPSSAFLVDGPQPQDTSNPQGCRGIPPRPPASWRTGKPTNEAWIAGVGSSPGMKGGKHTPPSAANAADAGRARGGP
jgi:hypothetical protein